MLFVQGDAYHTIPDIEAVRSLLPLLLLLLLRPLNHRLVWAGCEFLLPPTLQFDTQCMFLTSYDSRDMISST
jgi:hypothetical protein